MTASQISQQIAVLNADYTGIFQFVLAGTTTTTNADWYDNASSYSEGVKAQSVPSSAPRIC